MYYLQMRTDFRRGKVLGTLYLCKWKWTPATAQKKRWLDKQQVTWPMRGMDTLADLTPPMARQILSTMGSVFFQVECANPSRGPQGDILSRAWQISFYLYP